MTAGVQAGAAPGAADDRSRPDGLAPEGPLLEVSDLVQEFVLREEGGGRGGVVQAVSGVYFQIRPGETLGLVGETGSGKSTEARAVLQAPRPTSGQVKLHGTELTRIAARRACDRGMLSAL